MTTVGSVIQVKETISAWGGCLMIVDEIKSWGVKCSMRLPGRDNIYTALRLNHSEYYYIGEAEVVQDEK